MASFYNNYYRYYRPYPPNMNSHYPIKDKTSSNPSYDKESPENLTKNQAENITENVTEKLTKSPNHNCSRSSSSNKKNASGHYSFGLIHFKNPIFENIEEPIFEIFGIQLYLDDIIILGLLFFLYQENVQDEMLYIILILLLLS